MFLKNIKYALALTALALNNTGFAALPANLSCPEPAEIQSYQIQMSFPYTYDVKKESLKYLAIAASNPGSEPWTLLLPNLLVKPTDKVEDISTELLSTLVPVSATPTYFTFDPQDEEQTAFCIYKSTKEKNLSVLAYYQLFDRDEDEMVTKAKLNLLNLLK